MVEAIKRKMKGIILAGGKGTRLFPLTEVTNKHLIPVGVFPMIEYPLYTLSRMGIRNISVVTGGEYFSDIGRYLSSLHPEINFSYHCQKEAGGIAQALSLVETTIGGGKMAVILGDNVFEEDFSFAAQTFENSDSSVAMLFLKSVKDPERFAVTEVENSKIVRIVEKPQEPKSNLITTGLYFYDESVFDKIRTLTPSIRGEYEITDVNNLYLNEGKLNYQILNGFWSDAGTVQSRKICEDFVKKDLENKILANLEKNPDIRKRLEMSFGLNLIRK